MPGSCTAIRPAARARSLRTAPLRPVRPGREPDDLTGLPQACHTPERLESCGFPRTGVEVKIFDAEDRELPAGETGEVVTRSDCLMAGYWENPEASRKTLRGGWLHTGDVGSLDMQRFLTLRDRSKDLIISGGANIYPREVEEFLYTHPDVEDVQVIGVPDERYGEELMAWVRLRPGATVDADAQREFCRGRIAHFKIPRYIKFVNEFPMTVTGKVQKFKMRDEAIDELGLAGAAAAKMA